MDDFPFELRDLRYFLAVAEKKNFSSAADDLHKEQSQLSYYIAELEKKLGVDGEKLELFNRQKRPIELTEAGQVFQEEIRLILNQLRQAIQKTQKADKGEIGQLILGFNSSAANSVLSDLLNVYRKHYPNVEVILQERTADSLVEGLKKQQIDVGLMHWSSLYNQDTTLFYQPIREEPLILVIRENHPFASQANISLQTLADEVFILPPPNLTYSLYKPVSSFFAQNNFIAKKIEKATVMLTILSLVAAGVGVSVLPANVENIQRKGVIYKHLQEKTPTIQIVAMWRFDNSSRFLKNFIALLPNEV